MASAAWKKMTQQEAGAMRKHFQQEARENGNHSNHDIDKSKTKNNYTLGCDSFDDAYRCLKERNKVVDELIPPKRKRANRIVACFIELPCPQQIKDDGNSDKYFSKMFEVMQVYFGVDNVHGAFIHKDEVHEYLGKDGTYRDSLEHMHVIVSPYTKEKGINGKAFETKTRLRELNELLNSTCEREFGIALNTGEHPDRQSVEDLKTESVRLLQEKHDELVPEVKKLEEKKVKHTTLRKEKPTYEDYLQLQESNKKLKADLKKFKKMATSEKERADLVIEKVVKYEERFSQLAEIGVYERLPKDYPEERICNIEMDSKIAVDLIACLSSVGCRCFYDEQKSWLSVDLMSDEGREVLKQNFNLLDEITDAWDQKVEVFRQKDSKPFTISKKERDMMDKEVRDEQRKQGNMRSKIHGYGELEL